MKPLPIKRTLLAAAFVLSAAYAQAPLPEVTLAISGHKITAEVASTGAERSQGLMHRRMLPENRGMLFVFPEPALHAMWMVNTYVPLSVAFLDANGVIINIEDMTPHTQTPHGAKRPAKYALEANRGWFVKRAIQAGEKVEGLERAPPAK